MRFSKLSLVALACASAIAAPAAPETPDTEFEYPFVAKLDLDPNLDLGVDMGPLDLGRGLNKFLAAIYQIFPFTIPVNAACVAMGIAERALAKSWHLQISANSVDCADVTVIWARGTCEGGNLGAIVGPFFLDAIREFIEPAMSVTYQGLDYPATVQGYLSADPASGFAMARVVTDTLARCPSTKFVLSGYSQGGYAVHNAAYQLSADAMSKVKAVVVFGDPMSKVPVAGIDPHRVLIVCHKGDNICRHEGPFVTPQHLTYADDARDAAQFLVSRLS